MPDRHGSLCWFVLLSCFAGLGIGIARIATSLYAVDLQASAFQLGLIAGAQSIGILFVSLPVGILIQRYGPLRLFSIGSFLCGVLYAVTPMIRSAEFLILCVLLVSFCMPLRFISLNTVFMQQIEQFGVAKAGWLRGAHMAGFFLVGPVVAVHLVEHFQFVGSFLATALTFFLALLVAPMAIGGYRLPDTQQPTLDWREIRGQLQLLMCDDELRRTSIIEFLSQAATAYFGFFIVVIAIQNYDFSEARAAALVTAQGALFVLALFSAGGLIKRWGGQRYYQFCFALLAVSLSLLGLRQSPEILWLGSLGLGLGLGMLYIVNITFYSRIGERLGMGRVSGLTALVGPAGGLAGSIFGGTLGGVLGLQALFLPLALCFGCLLWTVRRLEWLPGAALPNLNIVVAKVESES